MTQPMADILKIQRFSINDGPGIRTTVFFKGCPLGCLWCHNPDSIGRKPQLMLTHKLCTLCGKCAGVCTNGVHEITEGKHLLHLDRCATCGKCVEACPSSALSIQGNKMSISEIMETILRDRDYYSESGGGITASGGEPLLQHDQVAALFKAARAESINTALDTSGYCSREIFEQILPLTDCLLLDIKIMDAALHKRYTGVDNAVILDNFRHAVSHGADIVIRHIVVPGVNDKKEENEALANLLISTGFRGSLELLPYHAMARAKYEDLGLPYKMGDNPVPATEQMEEMLAWFISRGIECRIN